MEERALAFPRLLSRNRVLSSASCLLTAYIALLLSQIAIYFHLNYRTLQRKMGANTISIATSGMVHHCHFSIQVNYLNYPKMTDYACMIFGAISWSMTYHTVQGRVHSGRTTRSPSQVAPYKSLNAKGV